MQLALDFVAQALDQRERHLDAELDARQVSLRTDGTDGTSELMMRNALCFRDAVQSTDFESKDSVTDTDSSVSGLVTLVAGLLLEVGGEGQHVEERAGPVLVLELL